MDIRPIEKRYLQTTTEKTFIKAELYYRKGGIFAGDFTPATRGFYLLVVPVVRDGNWEKVTAFSGYRKMIHKCDRYASKDVAIAKENAKKEEAILIKRVAEENYLTLEEVK